MRHIAATILSVMLAVSCASTGNYIFNEGIALIPYGATILRLTVFPEK